MLFRIFLIATPETIEVSGEQAQYLASVLRIQVGSQFEVINGSNDVAIYTVESLQKKSLTARKVKTYSENRDPSTQLTLAQALVHPDKLDLILQKATEIGVAHFALYAADTSPIKLKNTEHKFERWQKIIESACCQCRRTSVPIIKTYSSLKALLADHPKAYYGEPTAEKKLPTADTFTLIIGPESGFSEPELKLLQEKATGFSVGNTILRTETAAIAISARILL